MLKITIQSLVLERFSDNLKYIEFFMKVIKYKANYSLGYS